MPGCCMAAPASSRPPHAPMARRSRCASCSTPRRRGASSSRAMRPNSRIAWRRCAATRSRGPMSASRSGTRAGWSSSGAPASQRTRRRRWRSAWATCWARTSSPRAWRWTGRARACVSGAAPACRTRRVRARTASSPMSTAASCATRWSRTRRAAPTRTCCTASASRPTRCSSRSIRPGSTSTCIRPRSRCAFATGARCTRRCGTRSRTRWRRRARQQPPRLAKIRRPDMTAAPMNRRRRRQHRPCRASSSAWASTPMRPPRRPGTAPGAGRPRSATGSRTSGGCGSPRAPLCLPASASFPQQSRGRNSA